MWSCTRKNFSGLVSASDCHDIRFEVPVSGETLPMCAIRENKLMMKNYLVYFMNWKKDRYSGNFEQDYKKFYEAQDLASLGAMLNLESSANRFKIKDGVISLVILNNKNNTEIKLPKPGEYEAGEIMYSEYMPRLIKMQSAIIESLEKVSPYSRGARQKDLFNTVMLNTQI